MNKFNKLILGSIGGALVVLPSYSFATQASCPSGITEAPVSTNYTENDPLKVNFTNNGTVCGVYVGNSGKLISFGTSYYTTLENGGILQSHNPGTSYYTNIKTGGIEYVQFISVGGLSYYSSINGGSQIVDGSTTYYTTVYSGYQLSSGSTSYYTTVYEGSQAISGNTRSYYSRINATANQTIANYDIGSSTSYYDSVYGTQLVGIDGTSVPSYSGGTNDGAPLVQFANIYGGAKQVVYYNNKVKDTTIYAGATQYIYSGGISEAEQSSGNVYLQHNAELKGAHAFSNGALYITAQKSDKGDKNTNVITAYYTPEIVGDGTIVLSNSPMKLDSAIKTLSITPSVNFAVSGLEFYASQSITFNSLNGVLNLKLLPTSAILRTKNIITYTLANAGNVTLNYDSKELKNDGSQTEITFNNKIYKLVHTLDGNMGILNFIAPSSNYSSNTSLSTAIASGAVAGIMGNSMHSRVGELMLDDNADSKIGAYARMYSSGSVLKDNGTDTKVNLNVIEVGADYKIMPNHYIGALLQTGMGDNKISTSMSDLSSGKSTIKTTAIGLYYMGFIDGGYFMDSALRFGSIEQDVKTSAGAISSKYNVKQSAILLSLEGGRRMDFDKGYFATPSAELTISSLGSKSFKTTSTDDGNSIDGVNGKIDGFSAIKLKLGTMAGRVFALSKGKLQPYGKLYLSNVMGGKAKATVDGENAASNANTGLGFSVGAGVDYLLPVKYTTTLNFDVEYSSAKDYKNTTILFIARVKF